jgi:hypothetical protein
MRSTIAKIGFGLAFAFLSLNGPLVGQIVDPSGQVVTAGPYLPASPVTVN